MTTRRKMTTLALTVSLLLATAVAALAAGAGNGFKVRVAVPFEFQVGDAVLPAGEYTIERMTNVSVLMVRNVETRQTVKMAITGGVKRGHDEVLLTFNRYGDRTFLKQVIDGRNEVSYFLSRSGAERDAEKLLAERNARPQLVSLVVR